MKPKKSVEKSGASGAPAEAKPEIESRKTKPSLSLWIKDDYQASPYSSVVGMLKATFTHILF